METDRTIEEQISKATAVIEKMWFGEYKEKARAVMMDLRQWLNDYGYWMSELHDESDSEWGWEFYLKPAEDSPDDLILDIRLGMPEANEYGDEPFDGINFALRMVWYGGEIAGDMVPFNYTDDCWVSAADAEAVENRFSYFEGSQFTSDTVAFIDSEMEKRIQNG